MLKQLGFHDKWINRVSRCCLVYPLPTYLYQLMTLQEKHSHHLKASARVIYQLLISLCFVGTLHSLSSVKVKEIIKKMNKINSSWINNYVSKFCRRYYHFAHANSTSIYKISDILIDLSQILELEINFQKSSLQVSVNVSSSTANTLTTACIPGPPHKIARETYGHLNHSEIKRPSLRSQLALEKQLSC